MRLPAEFGEGAKALEEGVEVGEDAAKVEKIAADTGKADEAVTASRNAEEATAASREIRRDIIDETVNHASQFLNRTSKNLSASFR